MTSEYYSPVPSERQVTPKMCGALASRLAITIEQIKQAQLRVPDLGRLKRGEQLLKRVASSGFPASPLELTRIGNAIRDAMDFHQIAKLMDADNSLALAKEVDRAMGGTLDQTEPERKPYQFQSQLWVGAMLHYAGLEPCVPSGDELTRPDYTIRVVLREYGVEVKRPEREATVERAVKSAATRLSACGLQGMIAIDLSDCLEPAALQQIAATPAGAPYNAVEGDYVRMRDRIGELVFDRRARVLKPGYVQVSVVLIFARGYRWHMTDLSVPDPFAMTQIGVFTSTLNTLSHLHGLEIRKRFIDGMKAAGFFISHESSQSV